MPVQPICTPSVPVTDEVLTVSDVAKILKFSKGQVYDLTRSRARVRQTLPIPTLRINGNLRFLRSEVEQWLRQLSTSGRAN